MQMSNSSELNEPADPKLLMQFMESQNKVIEYQTKIIFDATKYNYGAFGAIFLLTSGPFYKDLISTTYFIIFSCIVVASISIACSVFVVNRGIYTNLARKKRSIAERTWYRQKSYLYYREKLKEERQEINIPNEMGIVDYIKSSYPMKTINLLPFMFSALIVFYIVLVHFGLISAPTQVTHK